MPQSSVFTQNTYSFYITIQLRFFYSLELHIGSYVVLSLWGSCTDLHSKLEFLPPTVALRQVLGLILEQVTAACLVWPL